MALTPEEIVSAEADYIDSDGVAFQFSTAAVRKFILSLLAVQAATSDGTVVVQLLEDGVPTNHGDFGNFQIDAANSVVTLYSYAGAVRVVDYQGTLASMTNNGPGAYSAIGAPTGAPAVEVRLSVSFSNPATGNNPAAVVPLELVYYDAAGGGSGGTVKVLALTGGRVVETHVSSGQTIIEGHEAASDPHPQYMTQAEADALYATVGHLHDARYVNLTGDTMTGDLSLGPNALYAVRLYDSANAAYYVDPDAASTLRQVNVTYIYPGAAGAPNGYSGIEVVVPATDDMDYARNNGALGVWRMSHHTGLSFSAHPSYGGTRFYSQGYGGTFTNAFETGVGTTLDLEISSGVKVHSSLYAHIMYDLGDTSYYVDPAQTSRLNQLTAYGYGRLTNATGHLVGGYNNVGVNETHTNPIYSIGSAYNPDETTLANFYGIGYTYSTSASFVTLPGVSGWGLYIASAGAANIFLDAGNGTVSVTGDYHGAEYYATGWFRNVADTGMYNGTHLAHWYADGNYWNVAVTGAGGVRIRNGYAGPIAGYLHGDGGSYFGLLDKNQNWRMRVHPTLGTEFLGEVYAYGPTGNTGSLVLGRSAATVITGIDNTAVGSGALANKLAGDSNTAVGHNAMSTYLNGASNTAVGASALKGIGFASGSRNVGVGSYAGSDLAGSDNVVVGYNAMKGAEGTACVVIGAYAYDGGPSPGLNHTFVGTHAAGTSSGGYSECFAYGYKSGGDALKHINGSFQGVLGNNNTTVIYTKVGLTVVSDIRDKVREGEVPLGLDFVRAVPPIEYRFRVERGSLETRGRSHFGFSAQQFLAEMKKRCDTEAVIDDSDSDKLKMKSDETVPILWNAVRELADQVEELRRAA